MLRIDVDCQRCNKRIGTARISVGLQSHNTGEFARMNQRYLNVDHDDLKYWSDRHSMEECNAKLDAIRAKREAELLARERAFELPISVS